MEELEFSKVLNKSITTFIKESVNMALKHPELLLFGYKVVKWQNKASKLRLKHENENIHVPPFMIVSITNECNLNCLGCYAKAHKRSTAEELSINDLDKIFRESSELGISIIMIVGGEPLTKPEFLDVTAKYPEILFPVFTNGTLINEEIINKIEKQKNVLPLISIEGYETETNLRRGTGVYESFKNTMDKLKGKSIFWGTSITVTSKNFDLVTSDEFLNKMFSDECRLYFYVEYVPIKPGTDDLLLSMEQREKLMEIIKDIRKRYDGAFIAFPGDEKDMGGCLSSGRGFVHISAEGNMEPCPFSPYSDINIKNVPLKEALQSEFLKTIRENHDKLTELEGGCALWNEKEWVQSLLIK